jgi:twitching motility protein PilT
MEKLNEYLQTLLSTCSYELHLEPNKIPFTVSDNGATNVANAPLLGTQISTLIFPLIPMPVKMELPNRNEIEFVHNHNLGNFSFLVKKSPAGFIVTIRPMLSDVGKSSAVGESQNSVEAAGFIETESNFSQLAVVEAAANPSPLFSKAVNQEAAAPPSMNQTAQQQQDYSFESSSSVYETQTKAVDAPVNAPIANLEIEEVSAYSQPENSFNISKVDVISANDPEFITTFSDTSTYDPPGRASDYDFDGMSSNSEYAAPVSPAAPSIQTPPPPADNFFERANQVSQPQFAESQLQSQTPQSAQPPIQQFQMPEITPQQQVSNFSAVSAANPQMKARMDALFRQMAEIGASDLHLSVSMPPMVRKDGRMQALGSNEPTLTPELIKELLVSIIPAKNQEEFSRRSDTDFAYEITGLARFRANIFMDRKGMGGVFRIIPTKILTAQQLGLSQAIMNLCELSKGLVVVTGPTGSGKSTTLCAMIDHINKSREDHIITIEDPIEFTHENQRCLVNQREVHNHTDSFKDALRAALREDPDILLVGEMRDLETISIAIETAETGHLVFGTLHTTTAASTVDRIIDQFPADRQQQIRVMLSESLKGVIAQTLLPKKGGGRVAALEVLIVTPAISNLIREGKTFQIPSAMQTGKQHGMVMLNDALFALVQKGLVEPRDAYIKAVDKTGMETLLTRSGFRI